VGVVDDHGVGCRDGHDLQPPLHRRDLFQGLDGLCQGDAQVIAAGQRPQGVVNGEPAWDRHRHRQGLLGRIHQEAHPVRFQPDPSGPNFCPPLVDAKGHHPAVRAPDQQSPGVVVQVEAAAVTLAEEQALGLAVGRHVPVEIQMVPRQVREDARAEAQPRRPPLGQGVGGDLHHHMAAPGPLHFGQEGLQGVGVRCGPPGG